MFAALHIPDFAITAALGSDGGKGPCAILASPSGRASGDKLPLLAVNGAARRAGLDAGMVYSRALVRCPDLRLLPADPAAEHALREELVALAESVTPDVEITTNDSVILDLGHRWFGGEEVPARFELPGRESWYAFGDTPDLAHLGARHPATRGRLVSSADLETLPLEALGAFSGARKMLPLLGLWGLVTLGDFMRLPRQSLAERLGLEAGHWHDVVHGKVRRLLRLHRPPESLAQRFEFEDAEVALEPVVFVIKRLLHTLAGRLACRGLAAGRLDLRLVLESGGEATRSIRLPDPQTEVEGMLSPLLTWLETLRLEAAVIAVELDAGTGMAVAAQREWFGRQLPQPERWAETLAKLEALLGPDRVGIPVPPSSHAPDDFGLEPAAGIRPGVNLPAEAFPACPLPLRRYRPPLAVAVAFETVDRQPRPLALLTGPHRGEIIDRRGPFPSSGAWWETAVAWQRLEWDIQLASRHLLRLVFEKPDQWQVEGVYP